MIRFRCHRCKRPLAVPDKTFVGKKVQCPGCSIVTIVPDIPGAQAAKARVKAQETSLASALEMAPAESESEFVNESQVFDDPLAELAGAADGYAVEDDRVAPVSRRQDRAAAKPRRVVRVRQKGAGPFMFFGAVLVIAAITGAAATGLRADPDDAALFFSLSGGGGLLGLVLFFVGLSRA